MKQEIIDKYFTRQVDLDHDQRQARPILIRKSDSAKFTLLELSFYTEEKLEQIGKGELTPTFLTE